MQQELLYKIQHQQKPWVNKKNLVKQNFIYIKKKPETFEELKFSIFHEELDISTYGAIYV